MWQELSFKHSNLFMVMKTCKFQVYIEAIKDRYRSSKSPIKLAKNSPRCFTFCRISLKVVAKVDKTKRNKSWRMLIISLKRELTQCYAPKFLSDLSRLIYFDMHHKGDKKASEALPSNLKLFVATTCFVMPTNQTWKRAEMEDLRLSSVSR